jgi:Abscisic acid G-protein coupled receptor
MHTSLQSHQSSLQTLYTRQTTRNTPLGILSYFTRHLFALYCLYRILSTTYTLLHTLLTPSPSSHPLQTEDPISRFLALLATYLSPSSLETLDIEAYRHLIGFILVGIIILGSINAVINTVQRISKATPLSARTSTLCMSWTSGIYFVSTALMLRGSLPEKYSGGIVNALGTSLSRGVFERWFDFVFLGSVGVTGVGLFVARSWSDESIEIEGKEV